MPAPDPMPMQAKANSRSTRWSLIRELNAGHPDSRTQFYELCVRYWAPIHQYVRRCGFDEAPARTLSNEFFEHLQRDALARASRHRRFREFLHAELDAFLSARDATAAGEPAAKAMPPAATDENLHRSFALEVIGHSMGRLRTEAVQADRLPLFERLERYLSSEAKPGDVERDAAALDAKPVFVNMAIRQLRERFRRIVDDELARLVTDPSELAEEREAMLAALGRR